MVHFESENNSNGVAGLMDMEPASFKRMLIFRWVDPARTSPATNPTVKPSKQNDLPTKINFINFIGAAPIVAKGLA
jgi:hypothetical protein